jgi:hypothetical protein
LSIYTKKTDFFEKNGKYLPVFYLFASKSVEESGRKH